MNSRYLWLSRQQPLNHFLLLYFMACHSFSVSYEYKIYIWNIYIANIYIYIYIYIYKRYICVSVQFSCLRMSNSETIARQASLSITNSWNLLKLIPIESVMPSNYLILCHPLSSCLQSLKASGSFQMSQFFTSGAKVLEFQLQHQYFQ